MGRRRTKRPQRPQGAEHSARTARALVAHVPPGRKPCSWCCEGILATSPGFFRDTDMDFGSGRYGVCINCAGTGIELGLSKAERDEISRLRFRRSDISDWQLPRLQQQLTFAKVMIAGRAGVCEIIDRALSALDVAEHNEAVQHALVVCARMLDTLFPREEFEHQYERALQRALEACRCWSDRATLLSFVELVCSLPAAETPEYEALHVRCRALMDGHARYVAVREDPDLHVLGGKFLLCDADGDVYNMGRALRELLSFHDGLDALLRAQMLIKEHADVIAALERGDRSFIADVLASLWDAACTFDAGVRGDSYLRSRLKPFLWSDACSCRKYRGRLLAARDAVIALVPEAGTPELLQLFEAIRPHATRLEAEHNRLVDWVKDPLPYEELKLLLLIRWYWREAGCPTGCYAERLSRFEEEILSPPPPAPRRAIASEIAAQFQPNEIPPGLEGLDGALLADLHDCVLKFGREDHVDRVRRGSLREPVEVHVCISTEPGNLTILIIGKSGQTTSAGAHVLRVPGRGSNLAPVIWDKRVRVEDIRAFIVRIDEIMGAQGLVHPETGARTAVVSDHPTPKDSVDRTFATPGTCMPVLQGGPDAETMRQRFDHPEEVVILSDAWGSTVLCHQRDVPMIRRRHDVAKRVFTRHGLTTIERIGELPFTRIEELRKEIDRELAAEAS